MPRQGADRIERAIAAAEGVLTARFPEAAFAIAAGSIMRGQGTASSDIDLVVVHEHLDRAWRESFVAEGFPVEVFVHDPETLGWFVDQEIESGSPVMATMLAEGRPIGRNGAMASALQAKAREILARGPAPLTGERLDTLRYRITDLIDDLRGERTPAEVRALSTQLYQPLADLMLLGRGAWTGRGKWIPRLVDQLDPELFHRFDQALRLLAEGKGEVAIAFAQSELERHGGPLFAGYRNEAPADARLAGGVFSGLAWPAEKTR